MKKILSSVLLILLLALPMISALTASIGNARMILRPTVTDGETTTINKSILVQNVNNITIKAILTKDDTLADIIEIIDEEVVVEPGNSTDARFNVLLDKAGYYESKIYVTFYPNDPLVEQASVGLASNIIVIANSTKQAVEPEADLSKIYDPRIGLAIIAIMVLTGIVAFFIVKKRKKR